MAQQCRTINANVKRNRPLSIRSLSKDRYLYRSTAWIMPFRIRDHSVMLQAEGLQLGIATLISMCYTRFTLASNTLVSVFYGKMSLCWFGTNGEHAHYRP